MLRRARRHFHEHVEADLEVMPLMNLFVALIPMLLISAVFLQMAVLRTNLPGDEDVAPSEEGLRLSIEITDDAWIVTGRGLDPQRVERGSDASADELRDVLAAAIAGHPDVKDVVVASHDRTRYEDIVNVMDLARAAGLPSVSLTRSP
jgi:biopolymer transport protein ExbD